MNVFLFAFSARNPGFVFYTFMDDVYSVDDIQIGSYMYSKWRNLKAQEHLPRKKYSLCWAL